MDTKETGNKGEDLACEYLVSKGFKIIGKNCVLFCGEIDIICQKKWGLFGGNRKTIHFVEVKSSANSTGDFFPEERVDYKKRNKYKRLTEVWLEKNNYPQNYPCQVDIIAVFINNDSPEIKYFENVVNA